MIKTPLAAGLVATLLAGQALAADAPRSESLRIESETQFVRDYGDRIERLGPGVYQITTGALAGKTVTLGEAGLAYDLAALRAQVPGSLQERRTIKARIKELERVRGRYAQLRQLQARDGGTAKRGASGLLPCLYRNPWNNTSIWYDAHASVDATTGHYMDNGGGGLNYYYARASATASGTVFPRYGVPSWSGYVVASVMASNNNSGQTVQRVWSGSSGGISTGYVYSGPDFSHNLTASAAVYGSGDCFGYISVNDLMQ